MPYGKQGRIGALKSSTRHGDGKPYSKKPSDQDILAEARKQGMITIKEDGLIKMFNGLISFEEFIKL